MKVKNQFEKLTFEDAINQEEERISGEFDKIIKNQEFSFNLMAFSYLNGGKYAEQLKRWFKNFPREQFHILNTSDLEKNTEEKLNEVFEFLDLNIERIDASTKKIQAIMNP